MVAYALLLACAVFLAALGLGRWALGIFGAGRRTGECPFYSLAMGLGALTLVMFAGGAAGFLTLAFAWSLTGALVVLFVRSWLSGLGEFAAVVRRFLGPSGPAATVLLALIVMTAAVDFTCSLAPPTETDALTTHLLVPREYIAAGRMVWLPDALDSPMVMGPHLIYTLLLLLSGGLWVDTAPAVFHFMLGLVFMLWTWRFVARRFGKTGGYAAAAVLYTTPMITQLTIAPMVDMFLGFYSMAALVALVGFTRRGSLRGIILSGAFAAFAAGVKYSGFVVMAAVFATAIVKALSGRNRAMLIGRLAIAGAVAVLIAAPFPVRNWIWTGNPVAPTLTSVFGGPGWDTARFDRADAEDARYAELHHSVGNMLLAPWLLTTNAALASSGPAGTITFAFVLFGPLAVMLRSKRRLFLYLAVYCAVTFALAYWTASRPRSRYFLSIMPVASAYVAGGLVLLRMYSRPAYRIGQAAVFVSVLFGFAVACFYSAPFVKAVFGVTPRDAFLSRSTDFYDEYKWIEQHFPPDSKILVGATNDLYYLKNRAMRLDTSHSAGLAVFGLDASGSPQKALERMRAFGITNLFVKDEMVDAGSGVAYIRTLGELLRDGHLSAVRSWETAKGTRNPFAEPERFHVTLYQVKY